MKAASRTKKQGRSARSSEPPDPAFTLVDDAFAAESLKESYAQLRAGFSGTAFLAFATVIVLRIAGETEHFATWIAGHALVLVPSIAIYRGYRKGKFKSAEGAHFARRMSALFGGVSWGAAGWLWPITFDSSSWLVLVGGYAILVTSAAVAMATDPISLVLLVVGTLVPGLWKADIELISWGTASIVIYHIVCFVTVMRNRFVFRNMVNLRSENAELLKQALASASAAERARDQALAAANDKARFLAAASHDLRQPMQAVTLLSQTLERSASPASVAIRNTAASIHRAAMELTTLFEGILDLSQLELGNTRNEPRAVPIRTMLQDIADSLLLDAEARDMTINVAGPDLSVNADPVLLWRVVSNLASNALMHSGSDRALLSARKRGDYVLIQVWDQGKGIAEEDQARIFEEFAQLENPERRRDRGTGLGLSIVRRICAITGWRAGVVSRVGRGSAFFTRVPIETPESPAPIASDVADVRGLRVLVVEDDALVLEGLAAALRQSGAIVATAADAESALETLAKGAAFDVVLSDFRLPNQKTGMHIAESLAKTHPKTPCILLTGELQALPEAEGFPMPRILRKPASHPMVCQALSDACEPPRPSDDTPALATSA
ncbi:MAG: hybrid sensor histidine kinase/response regulator [Myxococcota bacterium]